MDKPLVTIVLPTYNRGKTFLKEAVMSILNQTYKNFELLIIDDGSDITDKLISSIKDNRIKYYKFEVNLGEYWVTNYGVSLASGKYLTWVHSDDILPNNSLEIRVGALNNNSQLDFVHGDILIVDEKNCELEKKEATDLKDNSIFQIYLKNLSQGKMISTLVHHLTIMMKKNFFYKVGPFDCSLLYAGDVDWLIRAVRIGNFARIPQILYRYRKHPNTRRALDPKNGIEVETVHRLIASKYV